MVNTRTLLVHVTQDDIDKGVPNCSDSCAVARALRSRGLLAYVRYDHIELINPLDRMAFVDVDIPKQVTEFVEAFDSHTPVRPFSFYLTVPQEYIERVAS